MSSSETNTFRAARDFLLAHRDEYATAYSGFQWPRFERFNWALDWFDQIAAGERRNQTALWVAHEDGHEDKLTFSDLSGRSNRIANYFRHLGVRRGDRVLLMVGNIPPLWETLLAVMKLGAVVIPATTLLTARDVEDRIARGHVRHLVCAAELASRIAQACGGCTRIAIGGKVSGWHEYEQGYSSPAAFQPDRETTASDPLQLYFTSGTTAKPKLVMHTQTSYPVGHLAKHVLDRHKARRHSLQPFLSGLGQARVQLLLCTLECGGHRLRTQPGRDSMLAACWTHSPACGVTTFCAPANGLAHADHGRTWLTGR